MLANQMQARIKLQSKRTPALHYSVGETWFRALENEFKKPYFEKVWQSESPNEVVQNSVAKFDPQCQHYLAKHGHITQPY